MEFSFGLKHVMPCNERFTGRETANSVCSFCGPLLTKTIYANEKTGDGKHSQTKSDVFKQAAVLSWQMLCRFSGDPLNKSCRWLSVLSVSCAKSCISLGPSGRWLSVCSAEAGQLAREHWGSEGTNWNEHWWSNNRNWTILLHSSTVRPNLEWGD